MASTVLRNMKNKTGANYAGRNTCQRKSAAGYVKQGKNTGSSVCK